MTVAHAMYEAKGIVSNKMALLCLEMGGDKTVSNFNKGGRSHCHVTTLFSFPHVGPFAKFSRQFLRIFVPGPSLLLWLVLVCVVYFVGIIKNKKNRE